MLVFSKRPRSRAVQLLLVFGVAKGMVLCNWFDGLSPGLETPFTSMPLYWLARFITEDILPKILQPPEFLVRRLL